MWWACVGWSGIFCHYLRLLFAGGNIVLVGLAQNVGLPIQRAENLEEAFHLCQPVKGLLEAELDEDLLVLECFLKSTEVKPRPEASLALHRSNPTRRSKSTSRKLTAMQHDKPCDADTYSAHITAFVNAFVKRERRERWLHLLLSHSKRLYQDSSKLHSDLDRRYCEEVAEPRGTVNNRLWMFFNFRETSVPMLVKNERAIELGEYHDAIFSHTPGAVAIYFFHDHTALICRRSALREL